MDVEITARHCSVPDPIREQTRRRFARLERLGRTMSAHVTFEEDHGRRLCEARVIIAGGPPLIANAEAPTFRVAVEQAADRVQRQLKRLHDRRRRRRGHAARAMRTPSP